MAKIVIHLKSGTELKFTCDSFTATRNSDNSLAKLEWAGMKPNSLYFRLEDISAIIEL